MVGTSAYSSTWLIYGLVFVYAVSYWLSTPLLPYTAERVAVLSGHDASYGTVAYSSLRTFFHVAQAVGSLLYGRLLDRFGVRMGFLLTFLGLAATSALLAAADSLPLFFLSQAPVLLQSGFLTAQAALVAVTPPGDERSMVLGRLSATYAAGAALGPLLTSAYASAHADTHPITAYPSTRLHPTASPPNLNTSTNVTNAAPPSPPLSTRMTPTAAAAVFRFAAALSLVGGVVAALAPLPPNPTSASRPPPPSSPPSPSSFEPSETSDSSSPLRGGHGTAVRRRRTQSSGRQRESPSAAMPSGCNSGDGEAVSPSASGLASAASSGSTSPPNSTFTSFRAMLGAVIWFEAARLAAGIANGVVSDVRPLLVKDFLLCGEAAAALLVSVAWWVSCGVNGGVLPILVGYVKGKRGVAGWAFAGLGALWGLGLLTRWFSFSDSDHALAVVGTSGSGVTGGVGGTMLASTLAAAQRACRCLPTVGHIDFAHSCSMAVGGVVQWSDSLACLTTPAGVVVVTVSLCAVALQHIAAVLSVSAATSAVPAGLHGAYLGFSHSMWSVSRFAASAVVAAHSTASGRGSSTAVGGAFVSAVVLYFIAGWVWGWAVARPTKALGEGRKSQ